MLNIILGNDRELKNCAERNSIDESPKAMDFNIVCRISLVGTNRWRNRRTFLLTERNINHRSIVERHLKLMK